MQTQLVPADVELLARGGAGAAVERLQREKQAAQAEAARWRDEARKAQEEVKGLREDIKELNDTIKALKPLGGIFGGND